MPQAKQSKPFLKRGTRKFLSNATVRSLNQKPNIVDFGADEEQPQQNNPITNTFKKESSDFKVEIKVNSKPPMKKDSQTKESNVKAKQNKHMNEERQTNLNSNQLKKKNTGLDDYIVVKNNKKQNTTRESNSRQKPNPPKVSYHNEPKVSMVGILKRQDLHQSDDDDDEQQFEQQKKQIKVTNSNSKHQTASNSRKLVNVDIQQNSEKINFQSDSQEEAPKPKNKNVKPPQVFPKPVERKSKWDEDQIVQEKQSQQPKGPSKILQKFYKKQPELQHINDKVGQAQKKLTTTDIPRQLKQQIFTELLAEKHSDFTRKLDQLHASIQKSKKERQSLQEGTKQLNKQKEQFQKEMDRRRKQFEEKVNAENGKLAREKRYLKDHQTNGKVDWRVKNEVEQFRSKLEQSQNEKKKLKADLTRQIERLKKKLQEQEHETDILKGQIRCIEMEKIQLKQKSKQVQKKVEGNRLNQIVRYWQDAPTHSYVSNFLEENFTLISLDPRYYSYQNLEYYLYYLTKKDEAGQLVSQEKDQSGSKITRRYKNGKEETQWVSKSLKETYPPPFRFTIVHHANGDLKMILPEGIHIYFDSRRQITQWKINPDKVFYNFHQRKQVQMKCKGRRSGEINQLYKADMRVLVRNECGEISKYRRGQQGEIARIG